MPRVPPGFRDSGWRGTNAEGKLHHVGYSGYSWSSTIPTVSSFYVHFLDFNPTWLKPQNSNYRAHGFPLRCLQE